jgi:hypothetical protein
MTKSRVEDHETTPIINIIRVSQDAVRKWQGDLLSDLEEKMANPPTIGLVAKHKAKLGKQLTTWVGGSENRRFYLWVGENWRIFVHDRQGVGFEVNEGLTVEEAMAAWQTYRSLMGVA